MGQRVARTPFLRSLARAPPFGCAPRRARSHGVGLCQSLLLSYSLNSLTFPVFPPSSHLPSLLSISFLPSSHIPSLLPSSHFPSLSVLSLSLLPSVLSLRIADRSAAEKKLVEMPRGRPLHPSPTLSRCPFFFAEIEASFPHGVSQAMSSARAITRHSKRRGWTTRANDRNAAACHGS